MTLRRQLPQYGSPHRQLPRYLHIRQAPRYLHIRQAPRYLHIRQAPRHLHIRQALQHLPHRPPPQYWSPHRPAPLRRGNQLRNKISNWRYVCCVYDCAAITYTIGPYYWVIEDKILRVGISICITISSTNCFFNVHICDVMTKGPSVRFSLVRKYDSIKLYKIL